ncbi:MAG TPA: hypothetical protein VMV29_09630 [Ktedonobacterales bacterium]|nr:hypothetical protein [Ktedonobacterales bacterium]
MSTASTASTATLALPVAKTTVAIPAFHALGHTVSEVPTDGRAFDIHAFPDVLQALTTDDHTAQPSRPHPVGIWQTDLVRYDHADASDMATWVARKCATTFPVKVISEQARRALYRRLAKPIGVVERVISANIVTDQGGLDLLHVFGSAAPSVFFNHMQLATGAVTDQVSATMGSTGVTAIPVASGGTSFTNGMSITLGYGTANAETVTVGSGSTGTSIVCSATAHTHAIGDWIVENPTTSDNPSSVSNGYDSGALVSGAYTYSGSGAGSRQVQIVYDFPANSGAPGAGYTDLWMASAATIATNTTGAHLTRSPLAVNSTTGANVTISELL